MMCSVSKTVIFLSLFLILFIGIAQMQGPYIESLQNSITKNEASYSRNELVSYRLQQQDKASDPQTLYNKSYTNNILNPSSSMGSERELYPPSILKEDDNTSHTKNTVQVKIERMRHNNRGDNQIQNTHTFYTGKTGSLEVLFEDDFEYWWWEGLTSYWWVGDSNPESGNDYWDVTNYRSHSSSHSVWCAQVGTHSFYGEPNSDVHYYDNNMAAYLSTKSSWDISDKDLVYIEFYAWWYLENNYDYIDLAIKSDATNDQWVGIWSKTGYHGYWDVIRVPVDYKYYSNNFYVGFNFRSDDIGFYEGVYIDDFKIVAADIVLESWSINTLEAMPGDRLEVSYTISNPSPLDVTVWLGMSLIDPNGNEIIDPSHDVSVTVPAYTTYTASRYFDVPSSATPGTYTIMLAIWADKVNGLMVHQYDMVVAEDALKIGYPNLIVEDIWASPSSPEIESPADVYFRIKNIGDITATNFAVYLEIYNENYGNVYAIASVDSLEPGEYINIYMDDIILSDYNIGPGYQTVLAIADYYNNVKESNENDNTRTESIYWRGPDLIITDISWKDWFGREDQTIGAGHELTITLKIKNIGDGTTHKTMHILTVLKTTGQTLSYAITTLDLSQNPLEPGEELIYTVPKKLYTKSKEITDGQYIYIEAYVDVYHQVLELNEDNNDRIESTELEFAEWTLILYASSGAGCGNDLSGLISADIEAFEASGSSFEVNAIIMADITNEDTKVYYALQNNLIEIPLSEINGNWDNEVNMGDGNTLAIFATYMFTRFRAHHYVLILDDHGGGIKGIICDDKLDDNIRIDELGDALQYIVENADINKIDLFGMDACLMSMIEVMYEIKQYAEYVVASEMNEYYSWRYEDIINHLKENPNLSVLDLGKYIVDTYVNYVINNGGGEKSVTLAVIDTSYVDELAYKVNELAIKLAHISYKYRERINTTLAAVQRFPCITYADLYNSVELLDQIIDYTYDDIHELINDVKYYYEKTVIYFRKYSGSADINVDHAHGLSTYLPVSITSSDQNSWRYCKLEYYSRLEFYTLSWDEFIDNLFEPQYGIYIEDVDVEPSITPLGSYVSVTIVVRNNSTYSENVWFGTSLFDSSGVEYIDPSNDVIIRVDDGVYSFSRLFRVSDDMPIDVYDVLVALWWYKDPDTGLMEGLIDDVSLEDALCTYMVVLGDAAVIEYVDRDHDNLYSSISISWNTQVYLGSGADVSEIPAYARIYARSEDGTEYYITTISYDLLNEQPIVEISLSPGTWDLKIVVVSYEDPSIILDIIDYGEDPDISNIVFDDDDRYISIISIDDAQAEYGDEIIFCAHLTREDGTPIANAIVNFYIYLDNNWVYIGSDDTNVAGYAVYIYEEPLVPGSYSIKAVYQGSSEYKPSDASATLTISKEETVLEIEVLNELRYGDIGQIKVLLKDDDDTPVGGAYVELYLISDSSSEYIGNGTTNNYGYFILSFTVNIPPGNYVIKAVFNGNMLYEGTISILDVIVEKEYTIISVENSTFHYEEPIVLKAMIHDDEDTPVPSLNVKFYLITDYGEEFLGENMTDSDGIAILHTSMTLDPGYYKYKVVIDTNEYYVETYAIGELIIKCKPPEILEPLNGSYVNGNINIVIMAEHYFDIKIFLVHGDDRYLVKNLYNVSGEISIPLTTTQYKDGKYELIVNYTYSMNNYVENGASRITMYIDNTPPSVSITEPDNNTVVSDVVTIRFNYSDNISPIQAYLNIDGTTVNVTGSYIYTLDTRTLNDGRIAIKLIAIDKPGNRNETYITLIIDNTMPIVSIISPQNQSVIHGIVVVKTYYYDANLMYAKLYINGFEVPMVNYTYVWNTTGYIDGTYNITLVAMDIVNHVSRITVLVDVDNTCPYAEIIWPGEGTVVSGIIFVHVNYSDPHISSAKLYVDDTLYGEITGSYAVEFNTTMFSDGVYYLSLVVSDIVGHTTTVTVSIEIDNTAPVVVILEPGNGAVVSGTITLKFNYSDKHLDTVWLYIDDTVINVSGTYEYMLDTTKLADGPHIVRLVARDLASHESSYEVIIDVDNTPPIILINSPRNNSLVSHDCVINISIGEAHILNTFIFINNELVAENTTLYIWDTRGVPDGLYSIVIKVLDIVGHETLTTTYVYVDNTPPEAVIIQPKNNKLVGGTITIMFNYSDANLDKALLIIGDTIVDVTGSNNYTLDTTKYLDGPLNIELIVSDKAGNTANNSLTIIVDNSPPKITIYLRRYYVSGIVNITWSVEEEHLREVLLYINNTMYNVTNTSFFTWNTTMFSDGLYIIAIKAVDLLNHAGIKNLTIMVDNTPPITRDNATTTWFNEDIVIVLYTHDELSGVNATYYRVDGGEWIKGNIILIEALDDHSNDGTHIVEYFSVDNCGNIEPIRTIYVYLDTTPPSIMFWNFKNMSFARDIFNVEFRLYDELSGVASASVYLDGIFMYKVAVRDPYNQNYTITIITTDLNDGEHLLSILVEDTAGNTIWYNTTFIIDNTLPEAEIISPRDRQLIGGIVEITLRYYDENIEHATLVIDDTSIDVTGTNSYSLDTSRYMDGPLMVELVVVDKAGNLKKDSVTLIIDNTAPYVEIVNPPRTVSGLVNISWLLEEPNIEETILYINNTAINVTGKSYYILDTSKLPPGIYIIRIIAIDKLNHTSMATTTIKVEPRESPYLSTQQSTLTQPILPSNTSSQTLQGPQKPEQPQDNLTKTMAPIIILIILSIAGALWYLLRKNRSHHL